MAKLLALKLSVLNEADFNWVYSRLENEARNELDPLIHEIKEIGFDISQNEVDGLIEKSYGVAQSIKKNQDASFQLVADAGYHEVQKVFSAESPILLNSLLSIENWEWKADKKFTAQIRTNGGVKISDLETKQLLRASILKATAQQLQANKQHMLRNQRLKKTNKISSFFGELFKRNRR